MTTSKSSNRTFNSEHGPLDADAWFAVGLEAVPEIYEKPYDQQCLVILQDEQPAQLLREPWKPIPAQNDHTKRVGHEFELAGTCNIFMFAQPLAGLREVSVRTTKTKVEWATEMARPQKGRYACCPKLIVVCDSLDTYTKGGLYEVFEPPRARALVRRIEFHKTPRHGSWLNFAENELSSRFRQSGQAAAFPTSRLSEAVKKWDWLRAGETKTLGTCINARCLSQFFRKPSAKKQPNGNRSQRDATRR